MYNYIPGWGECHYMERGTVVLKEEGERGECYVCISVVARSSNVYQVTTNNNNQCYNTAKETLENCSSDNNVTMMLYRTGSIHQVLCPITGKHIVVVERTSKG